MAAISSIIAGLGLALTAGTTIASVAGGGGASPPPIRLPGQPARSPRTDTGASVSLGSDGVTDQRVSGTRASASSSRSVDVLGGLGAGGSIRI